MTGKASLAWLVIAAAGACNSSLKVAGHDGGGGGKPQPRDGSAGGEVAPVVQHPIGGQCAPGYAACGSGDGLLCFDLGQAHDNCGACGHACAQGVDCVGGACQQRACNGPLSFKTLVLGSTGEIKAMGDFDGDGILDLIGAGLDDMNRPDGSNSVFYGAGDGTFPTVVPLALSSATSPPDGAFYMVMGSQIIAADVDGDGRPDLVRMGEGESAFTVRLGTGTREAPFGEPTSYPTSTPPSSLLVADFDADGRPDLMASVKEAIEYWHGGAGGTFERQTVLESPDLAGYWTGIASAMDWNGDGTLDLVYGDGGYGGIWSVPEVGAGGRLHYRLGHGDGTFGPDVTCGLTMGIVGDLDNDHRPDLISSSSVRGATLLLGIDGCSARQLVPITDWTKQGGVVFADLNGDGNPDVVIDDNEAIMVHIGDGQGGFPHALTLPAPEYGQWPLGSFFVGDVNRDSKLDVVFSRDNYWGVLLNTCP